MQPRMAMNVAQHKIVNYAQTFFAHQFFLVFVYLICSPRQLLFFQCGLEMPKGWIPLKLLKCCLYLLSSSPSSLAAIALIELFIPSSTVTVFVTL